MKALGAAELIDTWKKEWSDDSRQRNNLQNAAIIMANEIKEFEDLRNEIEKLKEENKKLKDILFDARQILDKA